MGAVCISCLAYEGSDGINDHAHTHTYIHTTTPCPSTPPRAGSFYTHHSALVNTGATLMHVMLHLPLIEAAQLTRWHHTRVLATVLSNVVVNGDPAAWCAAQLAAAAALMLLATCVQGAGGCAGWVLLQVRTSCRPHATWGLQ